MTETKTGTPADKARAARLLLVTAKLLKETVRELDSIEHGQHIYHLRNAVDECLANVLTMPDVRIALFAVGENLPQEVSK